jgi:hypothetical protein
MTIEELLEELDGAGIIITDKDLIVETLCDLGFALFDVIPEKG